MSEMTPRALPRWRDVVVEQIGVTGLSLRPAALIVAAVLALGTLLIGADIAGGGRGFDSDEIFPTAIVAFFYPFAVWNYDKRFAPAFLWTLPVDRRRLALAKVFAGWVWLMAGVAFFALWLLVLGLIGGAPIELTVTRVPLTTTIAAYLFGSAVVLGLRHPLRWLIGAAGVLALMGALGRIVRHPDDSQWGYVPGSNAFVSAINNALTAWLSVPESARWAFTTLLWCGAGLAAVWAAASRHRERRAH